MTDMQNYIDKTMRKASFLGKATAYLELMVECLGDDYPTLYADAEYRAGLSSRVQELLNDIEKENTK